MTPDVRFGKPAIGGISTDVLWEHDQAGAAVDEIADDIDLTVDDVRWALAYENSARATTAAWPLDEPGRPRPTRHPMDPDRHRPPVAHVTRDVNIARQSRRDRRRPRQ